jgi:AbrB family looped-hinge helix DNA binding protein
MATRTLPKTESIELSDDYAIVIPPSMRETLGIHPGQKLQLLVYKDQIILMPEVHPRDVRGSMPDLDTTVERDEDRV